MNSEKQYSKGCGVSVSRLEHIQEKVDGEYGLLLSHGTPKLIDSTCALLKRMDDIRPGALDFLRDNKVMIVWDDSARLNTLSHDLDGAADCVRENKLIVLSSDILQSGGGWPVMRALFHEFAHCKEDVARERKQLPRILTDDHSTMSDSMYDMLPHEQRAEKFVSRMQKRHPSF